MRDRARKAHERKAAAPEEQTTNICAHRFPTSIDLAPDPGTSFRRPNGQVVVVCALGSPFLVTEPMTSLHPELRGYEGEWGCYAYWREPTAQEVAALQEREARRMGTVAAHIKLRQLEEQAEASWERPPGRHVINGQILLTSDRHLIPYGGGRWWVAAEWLWYIRNNGAADDAWDLNNIRTVGAGAIGWRQPRNVTFEAMLRAIAATVGD